MIKKLKFPKYLMICLLGILPILIFVFVYDMEVKWIILGSSIFTLIVACAIYNPMRKKAKAEGFETLPEDQGFYLGIMYTGGFVMMAAIHTLVGVIFGLISNTDVSENILKYNIWILVCIVLLFCGIGLYRFKVLAVYLLAIMSALCVLAELGTIGVLIFTGNMKEAFGFFVISNMHIVGFWFWVVMLIFATNKSTLQTIRNYNNPELSKFNKEHPSAVKVKKQVVQLLLGTLLISCLQFGFKANNVKNRHKKQLEKESYKQELQKEKKYFSG